MWAYNSVVRVPCSHHGSHRFESYYAHQNLLYSNQMLSRKSVIIFIWLLIVLVGPLTVLGSTSFSTTLSEPILLVNLFQRLTGLAAFSLLFVQILLGSYINFWQRFLGARTFKYHLFQGLISYGLLLAHPLLYVVFTYQMFGKITTFLLPNFDINPGIYELYLTYGRIAFVLLTIGVAAGYFRNKPFLRAHWRKFHILNYFSFFFIAIHAYNVGTDIAVFPFSVFYWLVVGVIGAVVVGRFVYPRFKGLLSSRQYPQISQRKSLP